MGHKVYFAGGGGGVAAVVQVECWLYNNHYSAQMAVQRGLSEHGPETL